MDTIEQKADEYPMDMLELLYGVRRYDEEWQQNYIKRTNLQIRYEHFNTVYAFTPGKLQGITNKEYEDAGDIMRFHKEEGYGTEYNVSYYQMNLDAKEFGDYVESVAGLPDDISKFESGIMVLPLEIKNPYTLEDLEEYRKSMRAQYNETVTLSPLAQKYIDKITAGCTTQWQRLKAIESALKGLDYTAEPDVIPKSVKSPEEYLEYFLLESREGYCAHFATAFVLLARAEGLPARYVEGFKVPLNAIRNMRVYSSMAHAWAEVYLEGVGWVPFEPTPDYSYNAVNTGWQVEKEEENQEEEEEPDTSDDSEMTFEEEEEFIEEIIEEDALQKRRRLLIVVYGVLSLLGISVAIFGINLLLSKRRYHKMDDTGKFLTEAKKNFWLLEKLGFKRLPWETLDELECRIIKEAPWLCGEFKRLVFMQNYQEYLYQSASIEKEMLQTALKERNHMVECMKKVNRWHYGLIIISLSLWIDR